MNNNEFKMDKETEEFINQFKMISPTTKINFDKNDAFHVVGGYLIASSNIKEDLKCDLSDLSDSTFLLIDKRNLVEKIQIIDGALDLLLKNDIIKESYDNVILTLMSDFINGNTFINVKSMINNIIDNINIDKNRYGGIINNLRYILCYIWFMPYSEYEELAIKIRDELESFHEENNKNE